MNREAAQTGDRETLQALIDADDQPVYAVDRELRYTAFNRAHAEVMRSLYHAEIAVGGCLTGYQSVVADRKTTAANLTQALAGEHVTWSALTGEGPQQRSRSWSSVLATSAAVMSLNDQTRPVTSAPPKMGAE